MNHDGLSPDRQRLLVALRARGPAGSPLTATQQGIWLAEQLDPGTSGYHETVVLRIEGPLDPDLLALVFAHLQAGNDALRARVVDTDREPRQFFDVDAVDWRYVDLSGVPEEHRRARVDRLVAVAAVEPFELATGPLWRARLVRLSETDHVLVVVLHHLITDGWSHGVLLRALARGYPLLAEGSEPPPGEPGYPAWLAARVRREREAVAAGRASEVASRLSDVPYRLRVPGLDPTHPDRVAAELPIPVGPGGWVAFDAACRRFGTTRFMGLTGLFALALGRVSGQGAVVLSAPVADRSGGSAALLGCLISVVPIVVPAVAGSAVRAVVATGTAAVGTALRHTEVPYREVVRAAGWGPAGDDPLTNVGIEEMNAPTGQVRFGKLRVTPTPRTQVRLRHDLTLSVPSQPDQAATLLYPSARWSGGGLDELVAELTALVVETTTVLAA
ncbi:condensation domain-containing protein [Actinophytocola xanthii]|uniref:Condensation domain-containing protein n=1 Tax=Actinophytocola xanthii TaxID=1912961 RepID=A0A1Q8CK40_9PSEU|nr:condensation domain-containing protein [Actinophytocola xanthii]OLF14709.1 hypothetical protein BU204_25810 [Actinophytocola xanthii]